MPQYKGSLAFPPIMEHEIIEYADSEVLRCVLCDQVIPPSEVDEHLRLNIIRS